MNRVYEIIMENILWNMRYNAYKKTYNTKKNVVDGFNNEEQRILMIIYNQYQQLKAQRVMSNPTVQKLHILSYITHEAF